MLMVATAVAIINLWSKDRKLEVVKHSMPLKVQYYYCCYLNINSVVIEVTAHMADSFVSGKFIWRWKHIITAIVVVIVVAVTVKIIEVMNDSSNCCLNVSGYHFSPIKRMKWILARSIQGLTLLHYSY